MRAPEYQKRHSPDFIPSGDKALAVSGSQTVSLAKNTMATAAFSMVKDQVSSFAERSETLMKVLDEVGKVHPFIQSMSKPISPVRQGERTGYSFKFSVAVSLFSTAVKMELTRRENNDKVLALNATMADMMDVLTT